MVIIRCGIRKMEENSMSEEKSQQRKWVREEVIILVTEYFKTKNLTTAYHL